MAVRTFRIHGHVQGVGFRWWTRSHAARLGVDGTVRNERDGSVTVIASAEEPRLGELRRLLEEGPPGSRVEMVEEIDGATAERIPRGFTIGH